MTGPKLCGGHAGEVVAISFDHAPPGRCAICGVSTALTSFIDRVLPVDHDAELRLDRWLAGRDRMLPRRPITWLKPPAPEPERG